MKTTAWPFAGTLLLLASACSTGPAPTAGGPSTPPADAFHRSSPRTRSGKPIHIDLIAEGSALLLETWRRVVEPQPR